MVKTFNRMYLFLLSYLFVALHLKKLNKLLEHRINLNGQGYVTDLDNAEK